MSALKTTYKVLRSFMFAAIMIVAGVYVCLYILLSVPPVQRAIKTRAEKEISKFLGSDVKIGELEIFPFREVRLSSVEVFTPDGKKCVEVDKLGAGIYLWDLCWNKKITITYLEVVGLDGEVIKESPDAPYNIDFIIEAFRPKDKNKPPTKIDLRLHNIVLRKSSLKYDLMWKEPGSPDKFDSSHIRLNNLKADISIPVLKNDDITIDLRRLSFVENSGFKVDKLRAYTRILPESLELTDFILRLPGSEISLSPIKIEFEKIDDILKSLEDQDISIVIEAERLTPSDFKAFVPALSNFQDIYSFESGISGNLNSVEIAIFDLMSKGDGLSLRFRGKGENIRNFPATDITINQLDIDILSNNVSKLVDIIPNLSPKFGDLIRKQGDIKMVSSGGFWGNKKTASLRADLSTNEGTLEGDIDLKWRTASDYKASFVASTAGYRADYKINDRYKIGFVSFQAEGNILKKGKELGFAANAEIGEIELNSYSFSNIDLTGDKTGKEVSFYAQAQDPKLDFYLSGNYTIDGAESEGKIDGEISTFYPEIFGLLEGYNGYNFSTKIDGDVKGNTLDNITGYVSLSSVKFEAQNEIGLKVNNITLSSEQDNNLKHYRINSDLINGEVRGNFNFSRLISDLKCMANRALPSYLPPCATENNSDWLSFYLTLNSANYPKEFFKLPIYPYTDIDVSGSFDCRTDRLVLSVDAPYLVQGGNKLIRNSNITLNGSNRHGLSTRIYTTVPAKNDDAILQISVLAADDSIDADVKWEFEKNKTATGEAGFLANLHKGEKIGDLDVDLKVKPTAFRLNGAEWTIEESNLTYFDKRLLVDNLKIWHDDQFVNISGSASELPEDNLMVQLADIDLSYIFEALNINYVTFGGVATGEITASSLFSKMPVMKTERLFVKDLSYNGAVLGDGELESHWVNDDKMVAINADIKNPDKTGAVVTGGIYVTKDSLSFDMDANKVNIEFLKPFMEAFTSDVGGRASGHAKLYGTFKDIDLSGRVFADSISMKVDYTNVYYHGSDSVRIDPGRINIPPFRLYDKSGNSALLEGYVSHRYFHEPEFEFKISDADNLLCYDTNPKLNPDWYGTIYGSGTGQLRGRPGIVSMEMDMTTSPNSDFTFVLSETQTAADYTFLTFSDRKREEIEAKSGVVDLKEKFEREVRLPEFSKPSTFAMDIRCSVTPLAKLNLIMDPKAGDKITATGEGPFLISYNTESDEMKMYGKYTLAEGNYNFSLQDLILRDFKIQQGSSITFNGDPLQAQLDITAAYRVNTNLSDLDKSFSTDRDLNRTNVPVDALLKVNGDMRSPEIDFDISLPTLTQDVERKVKSIISTDDMMNRQIIYLLALNRFYTPEYMGATSNGGGEFASVASSTLSSQLSNMMGQLTDKLTVAPSFRSDKGDFSDVEVDVALSSRLLDNRLLINGNFGYRDRSTSQTTFIGDFDIEYLLNKNGGLRLKAYNHFNDQYYYLKSALTTQGIGVVYRRDFDNPFTFLRRKKEKREKESATPDVSNDKNPDEKSNEETQ